MATKQTIAELTADVEKFFKELSTSEVRDFQQLI
jgi:hypothetical protein